MPGKPKEQWHKWNFSEEKRLGEIEAAISLSPQAAAKFLEMLQDRVNRGTGIRFKFTGLGASEKHVHETKGDVFLLQVFTQQPYIFPNISAHSDQYNSPYSRVEVYVPLSRL